MTTKPKTETIRQRRRTAILDAGGRRMIGDATATWRNFETIFTNALFPEPVSEADLNNKNVKEKLIRILSDLLHNVKLATEAGAATDLVEIIQTMPRLPSTRKTQAKKKK